MNGAEKVAGVSLAIMGNPKEELAMPHLSIRSKVASALAVATLVTAAAVASPVRAQAACPDGGYTSTPGERIKGPSNDTVYLVDPEGLKRPIESPDHYVYFFRSWAGIKVRSDIGCIRSAGLSVNYSSILVHDGRGSYYFVEPYGSADYRARHIVSAAVYDKYFFRWDSAQPVSPAWIDAHDNNVTPWT